MIKPSTQRTVLTAVLTAGVLTLSVIERAVTAALPLPPGVRLGLGNVLVLFAAVALGLPYALGIAVLKAGFVFLTAGAVAGLLSLSGGVLSVLVMYAAWRLLGTRLSYIGVSVLGAAAHNMGQLLAISLTLGGRAFLYLTPVLLLSGVVFGVVTGLTLRAVMPALLRFAPEKPERNTKP